MLPVMFGTSFESSDLVARDLLSCFEPFADFISWDDPWLVDVMPRRVDSDDDDSKPRKKKTSTLQKPKKPSSKSRTSSTKAKSAPNGVAGESVISAWAKRQTVESLDGIEDVESVSPPRERPKPKFDVDDGS